MSAATLTRPPPTHASQAVRRPTESQHDNGSLDHMHRKRKRQKKSRYPPPFTQKVGLAAQVYGLQGLLGTATWFQGWREWLYPPGGGPNIVKAYEVRPSFGVRIFFPVSYDLTSPQTLPTVFSIHGGGFCLGAARDDDEWNRAFADSQEMLVISLPYSKAPRAPFPAALHDLESLYLAVLSDESLPIDRTSVAVLGYDAGGNLALGLSQLLAMRKNTVFPSAAVSISGYLDLERSAAEKSQNRPYRADLLPWPRNGTVDPLASTHEAYVWGYTPYGHDLRDPLLSPAYATWTDEDGAGASGAGRGGQGGRSGGLPQHVCLVGAELDMLAHESWRLACRLVRDGGVKRGDGQYEKWRVPDPDADDLSEKICGRGQSGQGEMDQKADDGLSLRHRSGFEVRWANTGSASPDGSVKWILVPDELHGFDRVVASRAGATQLQPAQHRDTNACVGEIGEWLRETVWGI
ncbi:alpha/beta-hydrolase [Cryphonectria parasitica EP155]|uniref:Alpha/beta-hydrolase n=1 Tax=Cryphonectria parasitica (strain ATCC 38755 / EP155) TaxID=660469 RepID=A0A9P4Y355_CRYP1|nr:alpha/beta-hydrolase [Cryphonectria parasitica EP155]KAF3765629.1 alpha/beta-hydrolase [Cryphonectria parasitica EP155]